MKEHAVRKPPVPVELMLFEAGVQVTRLDYPDETPGESWWEESRPCLAVNSRHSGGRLRFTLAHEWGHLLLRHHQRRWEDPAADPVRAPAGVPAAELEANQFAGELLMPEVWFRADVERGLTPPQLARRYEVSVEAVRRRLSSLV